MNPHQIELDRTRRELREAQAELAEWRATGTPRDYDEASELLRIDRVRRGLGLPIPAAARMALALYDNPRPVSRHTLDELVPPVGGHNKQRDTASLFNSLACYLRKGLGKDGLQTFRGWGYALTPEGRKRIAAIVSETP